MKVKVTNIVNPFVAITTGNFLFKIGTDYSSDDSYASVTIGSMKMSVVNATFDSKIVNTTGNLLISFMSQNIIRQGSNIVITFPASLKW